jgi:DNA-binding transcriptional LysR family regulator
MDKLRAMASFARIVDKGSLTAAANDLGISLPSMVRTLAALERDLGARLLTRTTRRIHLTDEGRQYLAQCRAILGQVEEAEAALHRRRRAPQGRLAVTASVLFGRHYIAPLMSEFLQQHPEVKGELLFVDRVVNLVEEGLDAAVRIGRLPDSSLVGIGLGEVRRVICASPAYLKKFGVPRRPGDLREHRCIHFTGLAPQPEWSFSSQPRKVAITSAFACNQADAAIDACLSGLGPGLFLSYMVAPLVRAGKLRYILEEFEPEPLPVHFLYPQSRLLSSTVRAFADLCVQRLGAVKYD